MKLMNVAVLVLSTVCSGVVYADESANAEAEKLLAVVGIESTLEQATTTMLDAQIELNPQLGIYKDVMLAFFRKYMSYDALKPELIAAYAEEFSAEELREAREFYSTPTGRKFIASMPRLMNQGSQLGIDRVTEHMAELQQMIENETTRILKLQQDSKAAQGSGDDR